MPQPACKWKFPKQIIKKINIWLWLADALWVFMQPPYTVPFTFCSWRALRFVWIPETHLLYIALHNAQLKVPSRVCYVSIVVVCVCSCLDISVPKLSKRINPKEVESHNPLWLIYHIMCRIVLQQSKALK